MSRDDTGETVDRRGFVKLAGVGAASLVAGCSGGGDSTPSPMGNGDGGGDGDGGGETQTTEEPMQTDTDEPSEPAEFPVTITQGQMPTTLDPHNHRVTANSIALAPVYETLLSQTRDLDIVSAVATDWERIDDTTARFTIRDGVTFDSGNQLTAEDVAFSINRIVDDDVSFASVQNAQIAATSAEVTGDLEVELTNEGPNPILFRQLASWGDIVEKAWIQNREQAEIAQSTNGTGPFHTTNYEAEVQLVHERDDGYWGETPAASRVTVNAAAESSTRVSQLLAEETDIIVNVPPDSATRVEDSEVARITSVPSVRHVFLMMNTNIEPYTSVKFRQALNYAVDVEELINTVLSGFGTPTSQPTLQDMFGYNPNVEPYPYDPGRAEELIDESGFAGAEVTLHTPSGRYLKDVESAQAISGYYNDLSNLSCSVKQRDFGSIIGQLTDGNPETIPELLFISWGNELFDALGVLIPHFVSDSVPREVQHEKLTSLINRAKTETSRAKREALLKEANKLAHDIAGWVYLYQQHSIYGVSNRVDWEPRADEMILPSEMSPRS